MKYFVTFTVRNMANMSIQRGVSGGCLVLNVYQTSNYSKSCIDSRARVSVAEASRLTIINATLSYQCEDTIEQSNED